MMFGGKAHTPEERKAILDASPVHMEVLSEWTAESAKPETLEKFFCDTVRGTYEKAQRIYQATFVFGTKNAVDGTPAQHIYYQCVKHGGKDQHEYEQIKGMLARVTSIMCERSAAFLVVHTSEAWMIHGIEPEEMQAWKREHNGELRGHPRCKEVAWLTMEWKRRTVGFTADLGKHPILGTRTMGEWKRDEMEGFEGRFTGFLRDGAAS